MHRGLVEKLHERAINRCLWGFCASLESNRYTCTLYYHCKSCSSFLVRIPKEVRTDLWLSSTKLSQVRTYWLVTCRFLFKIEHLFFQRTVKVGQASLPRHHHPSVRKTPDVQQKESASQFHGTSNTATWNADTVVTTSALVLRPTVQNPNTAASRSWRTSSNYVLTADFVSVTCVMSDARALKANILFACCKITIKYF